MRCVLSGPSSSLIPCRYLFSPCSLAPSLTSLFPAPRAGANPLICAKQQFSARHSSWFEISKTSSLISSRYQVSQAPSTSDKPMFYFALFPFISKPVIISHLAMHCTALYVEEQRRYVLCRAALDLLPAGFEEPSG